MSSTQVSTEPQPAPGVRTTTTVDLKLEAIPIPVSDVDRAKAFYEGLEFMYRLVRQLTRPGVS